MFNLFKNWNEKYEKKYKKHKKWVEPIYFHNLPIKTEIEKLRAEFNIKSHGRKNAMLNAFYLGAIQGDFRKLIGVKGLDLATIFSACLDSAMYAAIKDYKIKDDGEFGALIQQYKDCMTKDYTWFGNNGINYSLSLSGDVQLDKNEIWSELRSRLNE